MTKTVEVQVKTDPNFDRFWSAYPRHVSKGAAVKSWNKLAPDDEMTQRIILAIGAQKKWRSSMEDINSNLPERAKKFVPEWKYPATWLNQACWDDEIPSLVQARIDAQETEELCQCGGRVVVRQLKLCARCYTKMANPDLPQQMKQNLKNMHFEKREGESWRIASLQCLKRNGLLSAIPKSVASSEQFAEHSTQSPTLSKAR